MERLRRSRKGTVPVTVVVAALLANAAVVTRATDVVETPTTAPGQGEIHLRVRCVINSASGLDVALMSREVDRIWSRFGVRIEWRDGRHIVSADDPVHLVVGDASFAEAPTAGGTALATLYRMRRSYSQGPSAGRPDAMIVVSYETARRLTEDAFSGESTTAAREVWTRRRLPVLVGRAVAHEVGHYLLETRGHSSGGLMAAELGRPDARWDMDYDVDARSLARIRTLWHARPGVVQAAASVTGSDGWRR